MGRWKTGCTLVLPYKLIIPGVLNESFVTNFCDKKYSHIKIFNLIGWTMRYIENHLHCYKSYNFCMTNAYYCIHVQYFF